MSSLSVKKTAFSFRVRAFGGARAFVEVVAVSPAGGGRGHFVVVSTAGPMRGSVGTPGGAVSRHLALPSLECLVVLRLHPTPQAGAPCSRHPAAP